MVTSNKTVSELVLVKERQKLRKTGGLAPVAHQVANNTEQTHESNTGLLHATVGILSETNIESTTGVSVGEDFIASVDKGKSQESGAWVR